MTISDIVALAKQGYKPADIKELLAMTQTEPAEPAEPAKESPDANPPQAVEPAPEVPQAVSEKDDTPSDKDILINQLQEQIKDLQQANTRISRPAEEREDPAAALLDIARTFM